MAVHMNTPKTAFVPPTLYRMTDTGLLLSKNQWPGLLCQVCVDDTVAVGTNVTQEPSPRPVHLSGVGLRRPL